MTAAEGLGFRRSDLGSWATSAAAIAFPAIALVVNHADTVIVLLMSLVGIIAGVQRGWWPNFDRAQRLTVLAFLVYFAVSLASYVVGTQTDVGFKILGRDLHFLLLVPALAAFVIYRPHRLALWVGTSLGSFVVAAFAVVQYLNNGSGGWAHGDTHHIVFGALSILLGIFPLLMVPNSLVRRTRMAALWVAWSAFLCGLAACVLSGSRGAWLEIIILPIAASFLMPVKRWWKFVVVFGAIAGFVIVAAIPELPLRAHIMQSAAGVRSYLAVNQQRQAMDFTQLPACISSESTLLAIAPLLPHSKNVRVSVVRAAVAANGKLGRMCGTSPLYALRFFASGGHKQWAAIPRSVSGGKAAIVFARGRGTLVFWPERSSTVKISANGLRLYKVRDAPRNGYRLTLAICPGCSMEIVPVAKTQGEYLDAYLEGSVGSRLEMWKVAIQIFNAHPLIGVGTGAWSAVATRLSASEDFPPVIAEYEHPHQQFLAAAACRGAVGFIALIALLLAAPLLARSTGRSRGIRTAAGCLVILSLGVAISGLTETMFVHTMVINWFVFFTAAFLSATNRETEKCNLGAAGCTARRG